jgi:hypothetical protein
MSLRDVANSNSQLKSCWKQGLQALQRKHKSLIKIQNSSCSGSIDIDQCLRSQCPSDPRWDYGLDIHEMGIFIEVHPAHTSEVNTVLAKLTWLKSWFKRNCSLFDSLSRSYHWIASGSVAIRKGTPQARRLSANGINGPYKYLTLG